MGVDRDSGGGGGGGGGGGVSQRLEPPWHRYHTDMMDVIGIKNMASTVWTRVLRRVSPVLKGPRSVQPVESRFGMQVHRLYGLA